MKKKLHLTIDARGACSKANYKERRLTRLVEEQEKRKGRKEGWLRSKRRGNGGRKATLKAEEAAAPDGSTSWFRLVSLPNPSLPAWRADGSKSEGGRLRSF